jgi:membrane-bound serine protease (ClpP class)
VGMRIARVIAALIGATLLLALGPVVGARAQTPSPTSQQPTVRVLQLHGAVDPFVAGYLKKGIEAANRAGDRAVVISINTPGGLDSSMRAIVSAIGASRVPVLCWTGPSGARAASAGTFVMMACARSAMAPGTEIGAAHPVGIRGSIEGQKTTNDAAAFLQDLARSNGYNQDFATRAVQQSVSLPAGEAFSQNVTNDIASSIPQFLQNSNGATVHLLGGTQQVKLDTSGVAIQEQAPGLGVGLLHSLIDPNLVFIFFYLGIILIVVELLHPGVSVPGILGTLLLVISIVSFGILPVQLGGVALLVASAVLYLLELKHPGIGLPAIGGTICLILGGLLLFDPSVPGPRVSRWVVFVLPTLVVAFFAIIVQAALEARRQPPMLDVDRLYGEEGVALNDLAPRGEVRVGREHWSAEAITDTIPAGTVVRVVGRSGLRLQVVADPTHLGGGPSGELPHSDEAEGAEAGGADHGSRGGASR